MSVFSHLPDAYPDETVHSLCSRHFNMMGLPPTDYAVTTLFGTDKIGSFVDLPHHLHTLLGNIVFPRSHTIQNLIQDHTLAPFYAPFWPMERFNQLLFKMGFPDAPEPREEVGSRGLSISHGVDSRVRYCPECAAEQRSRYREAYWLRHHQAAGVLVCPVHHLFLVDSDIRFASGYPDDTQSFSRGFYYPNPYIKPLHATPIDPTNHAHQLLVEYAEDVMWLQQQHFLSSQKEALTHRMILALSRKGYGLPIGSQSDTEQIAEHLRTGMITHYTHDTLEQLGLPLPNRKYDVEVNNWMLSVLPNKIARTSTPMRYWLLIRFLGYRLQQFWELPDGGCEWHDPYPCLSPNCPNYGVNGTYTEPCKHGTMREDE